MRLIDADALKDNAVDVELPFPPFNKRSTERIVFLYDIEDAPTIDAEPVRHGRWIPQDNTRTKFMCSDCKARNYDGSGNYCPNCGAKMDEEE